MARRRSLRCAQMFDVLVTDRAIPGMGGDQVAREAKALHPDLAVLMLTGYDDLMNASGERGAGEPDDPVRRGALYFLSWPVRVGTGLTQAFICARTRRSLPCRSVARRATGRTVASLHR